MLKDIVHYCSSCDWCQNLEGSDGKTYYFCMNAESIAFLEETGLCGDCTTSMEELEQ